MTSDSWGKARLQLKDKVGHDNYVTWIEPLQFAKLEDGILTFTVPSPFMGNWVDRYFGDSILQVASSAGGNVRRLAFVVGAPANDQATPCAEVRQSPSTRLAPKVAAFPAPQGGTMDVVGAELKQHMTFDTFVVGKPNELAHAAARRVAEGGPVSFNPLFLYSGVGLGKTHLMHAVAWVMRERDANARILFLSAEQFMYSFVQALKDRQMMSFKQLFRSVDMLMVDDMQFLAGKDSTQEEFFHTFNALVDQGKQIVMSADSAPGDIEGLERRIVSRLQSGLVVDLHPTSYELRLGILQRKLYLFERNFPGVQLGAGVLELLAHRITSNVRELEGALNRVFAFGSLVNRDMDVAAAHECLRDTFRLHDKRVSIDEIQRHVADYHNIRLADLIGPKRLRIYARPRQIAMYLSKQMTDRSLPEIARRFGGRDHTTIMHGIKRIEALRQSDAQVAEAVTMLERTLQSK